LKLGHDRRIQVLALLNALPAAGLAFVLLWSSPWPPAVRVLVAIALVWTTWRISRALHQRVARPLQTLANVLGAMRQGDFSFRIREPEEDTALATVYRELNNLSELLLQQRLGSMEATALLRAVMAEIDVAVFAFDGEHRLRLVNRAGEALLGSSAERLLGMGAVDVGLEQALEGEGRRLADLVFAGRAGRFEIRRGPFRQGGRPHELLVISDLTRPLREEERRAWQKLVRVLGHEINNSLSPIRSLSESLAKIIGQQGDDWMEDARQGLGIIASRAQGLASFMDAYTRLAKLPEPRLGRVKPGLLVKRVAALEQRLPVRVDEGPELEIAADEDQLAQALINLIRNAAEAALETAGAVRTGWRVRAPWLELWVEDDGPGLPEGGNLFVPLFSTKPGGTGIGLVLCRQIAEGHGGTVELANREGAAGARAVLRLPLDDGNPA
jgi:PAS domain S-box-containing protein